MINKKNKAEITTEQIVLLIVLIASFAVILFFIFQINLGGTSEDQICHNSVVTRSAGFLTKQVFPLNCKTSYICLSRDGSPCERLTSQQIIQVKTKEEVYSALAEQGANCWWMFGEGKADYMGKGWNTDLYCSICSQVAFDDSLDNLFAVNPSQVSRASAGIPENYSNFLINREDFYSYLSVTNVSGKDITYLDYFLGLQNSKLISDALKSNKSNFGYIDIKKQHLIMMGEFNTVGPLQDIAIGAGKGALMALVLPIPLVGGPIAIGLITSTVYDPFHKTGYLLGTTVTGESGRNYLTPAIVEANSVDYSNLNCANVNTLS